MKVIFKKDPTKTHVCHNCDKQFNWNKKSCRYGKLEYRTIQEQRSIDKVFCSKICYTNFKKVTNGNV